MPSGTATLSWDPNSKRITAAMNAFGFTPGAGHAMHLFQSGVSQPAPGGIPPGAYLNIHFTPGGQLGDVGPVSFTPIAGAQIPPGHPARRAGHPAAPRTGGKHPYRERPASL